jgi:hypothetical protein
MFGFVRLILCVFLVNGFVYADTLFKNEGFAETAELILSDSRSTTVKFNLASLETEGSDLSCVLRVSGEGISAVPGFPDVPDLRRAVQVPTRGRVSYEILDTDSFVIHLSGEVLPFQPLPVRGEPKQELQLNNEFYNGKDSWPLSPVAIESVEILRDIRVARVGFLPVSWNPFTGDLTVTSSVTVRFFVTDEIGENELQRAANNTTRSYIPFYEDVIGFDYRGKAVDGCYLVISTQSGIDAVSELIDWKNRKGFKVVTGVIPGIGSTAAEIDAYIENAFNTWPVPPEYILLVGDADMVPSPSFNSHSADNIYGVIGSGCVPAIHVGRLSGENASDIQYEAWKIVQHEMYPFESGSSWFQRGISLGHTEFTANSWDYMEYMTAASMSPVWLCSNGGITPTVASLTQAINDGASILGMCGHGDITTIYPPSFSVSDVAALSNGRKLPWFALVACKVGMFDGHYCFCEALLGEGSIGDARGGIGAMGPTTNSPYGAADSLVKWIFKGYFQESVHHMGAVTDWSKNEVYSYYGSSAVDNNHMHMLFGCPEMDIYYDTAPLAVIACTHPVPVVPGTHTFSVTSGGTPLEGALVAVKTHDSSSGSWMASGYSDASGNVSFTIPSFGASADVYVTATAFNKSPYLYQITTGIEQADQGSGYHAAALRIGSSPCTGSLPVFCTVPGGEEAIISFFDVSGRVVQTISLDTSTQTGGEIQAVWNGKDSNGRPVTSGLYYCKLKTGSENLVQPVIMLR